MKKIDRQTFLQQSFKAGAIVALSPFANSLFANGQINGSKCAVIDNELMQRLIKANDNQVGKLMSATNAVDFSRRVGFDFAILTAAYCCKDSVYYQSQKLIPFFEKRLEILFKAQTDDGTVSIGNLESPPDTAFLLESLCTATLILRENETKEIETVLSKISSFILKAGEGLRTGGVHTPNHRWVISAVLSQINYLFPDKKYVARIDDWLGEGIFQDKDGHYPERSINYAFVENRSFLTMSRLLSRPDLSDHVRKSLEMTYYYMEPDGVLMTTDSRRQDQYMIKTIVSWYLMYRELAIRDNDGKFAAIARTIETLDGFEEEIINRSLLYFMENKILQNELPASSPMLVDYEKLFTSSHLARIRRNNITTTIFGGVDWPLIIASGRSNSPNLFSYRKGNAVLKYLRLSSDFFSTGYFYSKGLKNENGKYILQNKLEVPYYQPLPKNLRNADGDYTLSPSIDDRFWNKMAFDKRPTSNIKTLESRVEIVENNGKNELTFYVSGMKGVEVTIELCFKEGGKLAASETANISNNSFLEKGEASYEYKGDTITFGPGTIANKRIDYLDGERYRTHFGTLKTEGVHVYLTGVTPFQHTLIFY